MEIRKKIKHKKITTEKPDKQCMLDEEQESIYTTNRQFLLKKIINEGQGMESIPNVGQGKESFPYKGRQFLLKKIINEEQGMEFILMWDKLRNHYPTNVGNSYLQK